MLHYASCFCDKSSVSKKEYCEAVEYKKWLKDKKNYAW